MNKKGFTLIELLVVIAIIGLLSTLAVVSLNNARAKSRDAKRIADIKQVQTALELYYNENNGYPSVAAEGTIEGTALLGTFMAVVPTGPLPADGDCSDTENEYWYESLTNLGATCNSGECADYQMMFCLGGSTGELGAGTKCASPSGIVNGDCTWAP